MRLDPRIAFILHRKGGYAPFVTLSECPERSSLSGWVSLPQSIVDMEKSESADKIRLETLRRAADALDCTLVYALVPRKNLANTVEQRAREIALEQLTRISHSMAIEDQAVIDGDLEDRIREFIDKSLNERDLWNDA